MYKKIIKINIFALLLTAICLYVKDSDVYAAQSGKCTYSNGTYTLTVTISNGNFTSASINVTTKDGTLYQRNWDEPIPNTTFVGRTYWNDYNACPLLAVAVVDSHEVYFSDGGSDLMTITAQAGTGAIAFTDPTKSETSSSSGGNSNSSSNTNSNSNSNSNSDTNSNSSSNSNSNDSDGTDTNGDSDQEENWSGIFDLGSDENRENFIELNYVSCGNNLVRNIPSIIPSISSTIYNLVMVLVPVLLITFGMIDLIKGISSQKEDEIRKGRATLVSRSIIGLMTFLVVLLVKLLLGLVGGHGNVSRIVGCVDCFVSGGDSCDDNSSGSGLDVQEPSNN